MRVSIIFLHAGSVLSMTVSGLAQNSKPAPPPDSGRHLVTKDAIVISRPARDAASAQFAVAEGFRVINVELKTDKTTYTEGDDLVVTVKAAESGHLRLLYQNAKGEIYTLFPNQFITDDRIDGGRPIQVMPAPNPKKPGDEAAIQIAGPNFGAEYLAAIVSNQPFADEVALREQLKVAILARSGSGTLVAAVTKDARVISRPASDSGPTAAGAGFAIVTLTTVRK